MPTRSAHGIWQGDLKSGSGTVKLGSGAFEGKYSYASRFESGDGTNPDELLGAAHAGCFSMALSNMLAEAGHTPTRVSTEAKVTLKPGGAPPITGIELVCEAEVPGIDEATFQEHAENAKAGCPISQAIAAPITLKATLKTSEAA